MTTRILVVDDEPEMTALFADFLASSETEVFEAHCASAAFPILEREIDLVITDLNMPGKSGLELLREVKQAAPLTPVIVMTAFGSIGSAVEAMRAGASEFLTKPLDMDAISLVIEKALSRRDLEREVQRLRDHVSGDRPFHAFVGSSKVMREVYDILARVAATESSVLIRGETGTGKELAAKVLHEESPRREGPFVSVNLAAVPESLLESQFFGHEKGAFTDARTARQGLLLAANGGTLFLDEVGDMPLALQSKLLRVLQERKVRPVGGVSEIPFDTRIVCATHKDLDEEVAAGRFREDLYYRLNVIDIELPPLRERGQDVLKLAHTFLERLALARGSKAPKLSHDVAERLLSHRWSGNVRELQNAMERAMALAQGDEIVLTDLPRSLQVAPVSRSLDTVDLVSVEELERGHILKVLAAVDGNKVEASGILGLDRRTLYRKLAKYKKEGHVVDTE